MRILFHSQMKNPEGIWMSLTGKESTGIREKAKLEEKNAGGGYGNHLKLKQCFSSKEKIPKRLVIKNMIDVCRVGLEIKLIEIDRLLN